MSRFRIAGRGSAGRPRAGQPLAASCALAALLALAALTAPQALAAGPGLPRTYDVQRIDSLDASLGLFFASVIVNGGDLNGDGKDDLLVLQGPSALGGPAAGVIHVMSGVDGSLIRTISEPEPDPPQGTDDRPAAFGTFVAKLGDIGRCPDGDGPDTDSICDSPQITQVDGVPELVASAPNFDIPRGVERGTDMGRVYVFDGKTGAVLKRIDMPEADRIDQEGRSEQLGSSPAEPVRPEFGQALLSPAGLPPCGGNAGVGPCAPEDSVPPAVRIGDLDGGGQPDILIGAPFVQDDDSTNPACDDTPGPGNNLCDRSGRLYMYRGEEIAGTDPTTILSTPAWTIKNPVAQTDPAGLTVVTEPELFGESLAPVGDIGTCNAAAPVPGRRCAAAQIVQAPDGKPDILVSAPRVDYPLQVPAADRFDIGVALLLDGATGAQLHTYFHPEPQAGSLFGLTTSNGQAVGDLGDTPLPDVYLPAIGQNVQFRGQGRGYISNGNRVSPDTITLATLNDPTPQAGGGFGFSSAGAGDLVGDSRNELLIGELSSHIPPQNLNIISDVHIFDPLAEQVVQTIPDPDKRRGSNFGASLAPLGDLNGDGFLDLAIGAERFRPDERRTGRLYIFRSNNTQPPPKAEEPPTEEPVEGDFADFGFFEEDLGGFDETGETTATRRIKLRSSRTRISGKRRGARRVPRVRLRGSVSAPANEELCEPAQRVLIQRRAHSGSRKLRRYRTFQRVRTNASGVFKSREFRPSRTYIYRAVLSQTDECPAAVSNQVRITVAHKAKRSPRARKK